MCHSIKALNKLVILLLALSMMLAGCTGSSDSDDDGSESNFKASAWLQDVKGLLSNSETVGSSSMLNESYNTSNSVVALGAAEDTALSEFKTKWNDEISNLDNHGSLMGYIQEKIEPLLEALEADGWDLDKTGSGTMTVTWGTFTGTVTYYSKPIEVTGGKGAKVYFGQSEPLDFENFNYNSDQALTSNFFTFASESEGVSFSMTPGHTLLILKEVTTQNGETADIKTFCWNNIDPYADRADTVWDTDASPDYVHYTRESGDEMVVLPNYNRAKDAAAGGMMLLYTVDKLKKEIYFDHLNPIEKHNRQYHSVIKLADLDESGSVLRIGTDTKINFARVIRESFDTEVTSPSSNTGTVNLVNDASDDTKLEWDLLQGSLMGGMKYYTFTSDNSADTCIQFNSDLNPSNATIVGAGCGTISPKPTITSDLGTYTGDPNNYFYLPSAGQTYQTIDLRVNLHSLYGDDYDSTWITNLNTD